ncbi:hypothetical protein ID866_4206 [Astraeus odoratus]|nr:hypothetical protein ID866_4206 [Astraeus odoratus]
MPAMSPTMTEGGISSWKKKEGESFSAGDVLLEIETDKATIDVEAQDDGVLAKILTLDGSKNVPVGKIIALLAEEGDDISNLEAPKEEAKPSPTGQPSSPSPPSPPPGTPQKSEPVDEKKAAHHPTHSKPLLPSVLRLLVEHSVSDPEAIKGSGVRGQLTKGDVLAYLGMASSPNGSYKELEQDIPTLHKSEPSKPLDGTAIRQLILSGLTSRLKPKVSASPTLPTFDSIIADYLPPTGKTANAHPPGDSGTPVKSKDSASAYFDGLL